MNHLSSTRVDMNRRLRIAGYTFLAIVSIIAIAAALVSPLSDRKLHRHVDVQVAPVTFSADSDALTRGAYLFSTRGCAECHGENGGGHVVIDDGGVLVRSPSIAPGGLVNSYTDTDWVRVLRHGVKPSNEPVFIMPSEDYAVLSDEDVGAIATYARTLQPAPASPATLKVPLILKAMYVVGALKDAAEKIDHSRPSVASVAPEVSPRYGEYIAGSCTGCHGAGFSGGQIPGAPPSWPSAANLTSAPDSSMQAYKTPEQFRQMIRTGKRVDGSEVSTVMPFRSLERMSDLELDALFMFLKTTPPRAFGNR